MAKGSASGGAKEINTLNCPRCHIPHPRRKIADPPRGPLPHLRKCDAASVPGSDRKPLSLIAPPDSFSVSPLAFSPNTFMIARLGLLYVVKMIARIVWFFPVSPKVPHRVKLIADGDE
jgi:hypothetical protein